MDDSDEETLYANDTRKIPHYDVIEGEIQTVEVKISEQIHFHNRASIKNLGCGPNHQFNECFQFRREKLLLLQSHDSRRRSKNN